MKKLGTAVCLVVVFFISLTYQGVFADGVDEHTKLLIHSDTFDGDTNFEDSSFSSHLITAIDDVHHSTDQAYFNDTSICFDGSGDYLSLADSDDWYIGDGDFTIDFWLYAKSSVPPILRIVFQHSDDFTYGPYHQLELRPDGILLWAYNNGGSNNDAWRLFSYGPVSYNEWHHIACIREGSSVQLFIDGVLSGMAPVEQTPHDMSANFIIGYAPHIDYYEWNGYIDEFRVSKGIARWTENFTPPSEPYSNEPPYDSLNLELTYTEGTLHMDFELSTTDWVGWNVYLTVFNSSIRLWNINLPALDPPTTVNVPFSGFPNLGTVGVLTTFTNSEGILCSDWETVDTGTPVITNPDEIKRELQNLFEYEHE